MGITAEAVVLVDSNGNLVGTANPIPMAAADSRQILVTHATGVVLTGALAQVGSTIQVASATRMLVQITYARNGGSITGYPKLSLLEGVRANPAIPPTVYTSKMYIDPTSFSAGGGGSPPSVTAYPITMILADPNSPSRDYEWMYDIEEATDVQIWMADVDAANPGTVTVRYAFSGRG